MTAQDSADMSKVVENGDSKMSKTDPVALPVEEGEMVEIGGGRRSADPAAAFVGAERVEFTIEEGKKVLRKIDLHILPLLCWVYMIQFADKTSLNYASVMGIRDDTHLDPNSQQYSWVSSIFYAGYIAWEFPTTYLLRRLPLGKYTSVTILCWGIVLACHAAVDSFAGLLTVRIFLGALEATVTPAFVLFTSIWYKKSEQARRVNAWLCCNGIALLIMAPFAYGLSGVTDTAIASWRILFLILGLLTVVTGVFLVWYMPDNQLNAKFLNQKEKLIAVERIRENFQGIGNRVWSWPQFREAFVDPRTYLYVLFSLLMNIPNGGITTFGSLIIKSFGFDSRMSLLLQMPSGFVDLTTKLSLGILSDKMMDRTFPAFIAILLPMVGGIMMITIPFSGKAGLLIGYYLISCAGASWGLVMVMISNNTLGYTKKVTVNALQILAYGAGNWIGPQTFRASDAPDYYNGKLMVAIMYGLAACTLIAIRVINILENRRRDKEQAIELDANCSTGSDSGSNDAQPTEFMDLTDFQQKKFRYVI